MANFFSDNKDLQFHLQHPLMRKIVELKERGFAEKDLYDYAPQDFDDAMDNYRRVLEIAGEVCGEVIAPNAEGVDHEGPRVVDDHVEYASGTVENMKAVVDAGLSGMTLPRKYDGLNFPLICFVMAEGCEELAPEFMEFAKSRGMVGIKGHRLVGGFRASCYNALPKESVEALVACMQEFAEAHKK
jgi:hypothetical protein